jgi:hypothetical protein
MATLQTDVRVKVQTTLTGTAELSAAKDVIAIQWKKTTSDGTGNNQADLVYQDDNTLAASGTQDYDLTGGGLTDGLGTSLVFSTVKGVLIHNTSTSATLRIGNAATNPVALWFGASTDTADVKPSAVFAIHGPISGYTVTTNSADQLRITNTATGVTMRYKLIVIGTSTG